MQRLKSLIESQAFEQAIVTLIIINAVSLGLETSPTVMDRAGGLIVLIDRLILSVFVIELLAKFTVYRTAFFRSPWRIFDLIVVGIALIPSAGAFSVLRALRILRVLRLVSVVPSLRRVIGGLLNALPGMGSILLLLGLFFYVFSVMATKLFGESFPEWFGSIPASAYSLFQVMTLESWSMGIVRPVMEVYPWAWAFFIPFILCTTFTVLNLFIGVVVSAMQKEHDDQAASDWATLHDDQAALLAEIGKLRAEIRALAAERNSQ